MRPGSMAVCKGCGAKVRFVPTRRGKLLCLDAEPNPAGNIVIIDGIAVIFKREDEPLLYQTGEDLWVRHWDHCPAAAEFRRWREEGKSS